MRKYLLILPFLLAFTPIFENYPYKHVYVEWVDIIATDSGWHTKEEIDEWILTESDTVKQSGFLYMETKTHIILIDSFMSEDYLGTAIKIPRGNIIKIQTFYVK